MVGLGPSPSRIDSATELHRDADVHGKQRSYADHEEDPEEQSVDGFGKYLPLFALNFGQRWSRFTGRQVGPP